MHFVSTRDLHQSKTLSEALRSGLAEDGGLYVPEKLPIVDLDTFSSDATYPVFAQQLLSPFFVGDNLNRSLSQICENAFNFPIPLSKLDKNTFLLELFHGPTLSFKDIGARFLAECFAAMASKTKMTIMVATSGDTGSAVASAFDGKPNVNVIILFPEGQISNRQQQQITCWGKNVLALAVEGSFDHCQQLVKSAFHDSWWQQHFQLSSANSINIGRLLPQMTYYAYSSLLFYRKYKQAPGFVVPTGNLGNATAGYWAKAMGFPIREIVLATNANKTISDYLQTGEFKPRPSIQTLANAMDVGNPSNFERLHYLFNTLEKFRSEVKAISVSDEDIKNTIQKVYQDHEVIVCPHTATACFAREKLSDLPWIVVATAAPSKFNDIIEPIIQAKIPIPEQLQTLLSKPTHVLNIPGSLEKIQNVVLDYFSDS